MTKDPTSPIAVTFVFPAAAGATSVCLVGEFNHWSPDEHPMDRQNDESFSITIELTTGRRYQYRYLVDGEEWENDWAADAYVPNEYGGNNSQIDLTEESPRLAAAPVAEPPETTKVTTKVTAATKVTKAKKAAKPKDSLADE